MAVLEELNQCRLLSILFKIVLQPLCSAATFRRSHSVALIRGRCATGRFEKDEIVDLIHSVALIHSVPLQLSFVRF